MDEEGYRLEVTVYALALLLPFSIALQGIPLVQFGGHVVRPYMLVTWGVTVFGSVLLLRRTRLELVSVTSFALLFLLAVLVSYLVNVPRWGLGNLEEFGAAFVQLLGVIGMMVAVSNLAPTVDRVQGLLRAWVTVSVFVAGYGAYQALARTFDLPLGYLSFIRHQRGGSYAFLGPYVRPSGPFGEPSFLGVFLAPPLIVLTVFVVMSNRSLLRSRTRDAIALGIVGIGVVLTFSLGTNVGLIVAAFVGMVAIAAGKQYPTYGDVRARPLLAVGLAVVPTVLVLHLSGIPFVQGLVLRFASLLDPVSGFNTPIGNSMKPRAAAAMTSLNVWLHYPLFGIGLGNLNFYMLEYKVVPYPIPWKPFSELRSSGSAWLTALSNAGLLGFVPFALMYLRGFTFSWTARDETPFDVVMFALFLVLVFDVVLMWVTYTLYHPQRWFVLGVVALCMRWRSANRRESVAEVAEPVDGGQDVARRQQEPARAD